ncbi:MAG: 50S ribosomal protein L3 [Alphaproteobacteria bacterium]|nr:50S ribosomal protein L3 [Alphaproteobacteria bacterium]
MRSGLIAKKVGMTRLFTDEGVHVPVTVLKVENCQVVALRTREKDGYVAVQLGYGIAKDKHTAKPQRAYFAKRSVPNKLKMVEFVVDEGNVPEAGATLSPAHFEVGQLVDVSGVTIGRGFQGAMKRWNFRGLEASHGVSISHRSLGGTGARQDPGRVYKGKKMHGHMGDKRVTVQNLKVVGVDESRGLLMVKGAVPGAENSFVTVRDAVKAPKAKN